VFRNQPAPTLSPTTLPDATYGTRYSPTITATETGYAGSFTFGSIGLPSWLSLTSGPSGEMLQGTPTAVGSFTFTITATDSGGVTGSQTYTLVVDKANLTITAKDESKTYGTTFLPDGTSQFTLSGLVNGDTVSSVTLTSDGYQVAATVASPGPTYAIN